ncbi:MAG TPA: transglutaminase-like domain-containing protein [Alphaproteobacteria bacterium]|nr:transglutaminase-like domain-containing protein [Alphaproteobacteria bacterium]
MRFAWYSVLLLVLLSISIVSAEVDYGDKNTVKSTVTISNTFEIEPTSGSYNLKYVNATLESYPKSDYRQAVSNLVTTPEAYAGDSISFYYDEYLDSYSLKVEADVTTVNGFVEIDDKILFPIGNLDSSLYEYTKPTEIIDVNNDIKNLASELIGDNTDLYEIEYIFAEYVRKNIAYDLSTITSEADQKSSWVLANRKGVCDELTNLFISLNRAAGIPARFVSGVAYTNLDEVFGESWVPHAWAEVYYPGVGWVPYDVTYGQYGFVDTGHIKLSDNSDSTSSNINYNYLGSNIKLVPGSIDIDVDVTDFGEDVRSRYEFEAKTHTRDVGFGSYDLISVFVENEMPYYQVADLYLAQTEGIEIIEESKETVLNKTVYRKQVFLKPKSSQTIYWLVKIDDSLSKDFIYTFPITVYNTYNETSTTFIYSRKDYDSIDYDYFENILSSLEDSQPSGVSKNIHLECPPDKNEIYLEDSVNINCILDNRGDKVFNNVNICIDKECETRNLNVEKINLKFSKSFTTEGLKSIVIKASVGNPQTTGFLKTSFVSINVKDKPVVSISDIKYEEIVDYDESFDISFKISKDSKSQPKNIKLTLISETNNAEWTFEDFNEDKVFNIKSNGASLAPNDNNYEIIVTYEDDKGNNYATKETFIIKSNASGLKKILLHLNVLANKIGRAFS